MKLNLHGLKPLHAPRDPVQPTEVTPKSYVDAAIANHANNQALHLGAGQRDLLDAIEVTAEDINTLAGAASGGGGIQTQLAGKVAKAGDTMTGPLTLSGAPSENLHAATKLYVDAADAKSLPKEGGTMTGPLTLSGAPTAGDHASTKSYVDQSIINHANSDTLHLTAAQNEFLDAVTVTATEVNRLTGVTSGVQSQLNAKFDKSGGTIDGNVVLSPGHTISVSKVPTSDTDVTNKMYVDSAIRGIEWKNPITDPNLASLAVQTTDTLSPDAVYIVGAQPTDQTLIGHEGYVFRLDSAGNPIFLQGRPVAIGDRFGVCMSGVVSPDVSLSDSLNNIITITDATPGAIEYSETRPNPRYSTIVFDADSVSYGETWTYSDEGQWVITNISVNLGAGDAINIDGNAINVVYGSGLELVNGALTVSIEDGSPIAIDDSSDELKLNIDPATLGLFDVDGVSSLGIAEVVINDIEDRLSKTEGGDISGPVVFDVDSSLRLNYEPTANSHAITKGYVDNALQNVSADLGDTTERLEALEADQVTKTYVDTLGTAKVSKTGDTMTGPLVLAAAPSANMQAANKKYVDDGLSAHASSEALHLTAAQNEFLDEVAVTAEEVNFLAGAEANIQDQIDASVAKAGDTMTGPLVLSGAPVADAQAANKKYVDDGVAAKVSKAGDTLTGPLVLSGAPVADMQAANKKYVDDGITTATSTLTSDVTGKVAKAGDTMTGPLTLSGAPTENLHAATKQYADARLTEANNYTDGKDTARGVITTALASRISALEADPVTKQYVDDADLLKLDLAGGTMTGFLNLHSNPTQNSHAVNKQYVDAVAQGLAVRPQIRLASTENLAGTYVNGTFGVNATITGATNGALVVDGMAARSGDRILLKSQTAKLQNGDYVVQQVGDASTPFILKRTVTLDESHEVPSSYFYIHDGSTLKGTGWSLVVDNPVTFAIGTDPINVYQFSGQGSTLAGDGLVLDGNTISVGTANPLRIVVNEDSIDLATTGVIAGTYKSLTVDGYGRVTAGTNPTTLVGFGITDAQPLNNNLTSLASVEAAGIVTRNAAGVISSRAISATGGGIEVTNGDIATGGGITVVSNADSAATGGALVIRDVSGNFSANNITAALTGNASTATTLATSRDFAITGDVVAAATSFNGSANVSLATELTTTGVTAGTYKSVTVDAKGRVTAGTNPTTLAGFGITDAASATALQTAYDDLQTQFNELYLFVIGRL